MLDFFRGSDQTPFADLLLRHPEQYVPDQIFTYVIVHVGLFFGVSGLDGAHPSIRTYSGIPLSHGFPMASILQLHLLCDLALGGQTGRAGVPRW